VLIRLTPELVEFAVELLFVGLTPVPVVWGNVAPGGNTVAWGAAGCVALF